ncbi:MAG: hypothetical protein K5986_05580 [Clostridium sp.]|uniref:transposase-like zinc-binding domain-containing protein n=1 Tax=Clostridium sp. DSM 8431 TaxID=1761781 RepID=UPI000B7DEAC2|nr:hypothetical protein [Clostridium sp. DSM 8431]MCR4943915.1 hypothetical protein [Clostridium sp.]
MNSYKHYDKVLEMIKPMNNSLKRKLIVDISKLIELSSIKKDSKLICPHCHNKYIAKNGKNKNVQRYLCKSCKKSFAQSTHTPIFSSKKDISLWMKFISLQRCFN